MKGIIATDRSPGQTPLVRWLSRVLLFLLACAGVLICASLIMNDEIYHSRPLYTSAIAAGYTGLAVACLNLRRKNRFVRLLELGAILCVPAVIAAICMMLSDGSEAFARWWSACTLLVLAILLTGVLATSRERAVWIRIIAVLITAAAWAEALSVLALLIAFDRIDSALRIDEDLYGIGGAIGMVAVLVGTAFVITARNIDQRARREHREGLAQRATLRASCPNCETWQKWSPGVIRCTRCKFTAMLEIEEPRCTCGYLLYRLTGDTCPECGATVCAGTGVRKREPVE